MSYRVIYLTVITRSKTILSSVDIPKFISTGVHFQGSTISSGQQLARKWSPWIYCPWIYFHLTQGWKSTFSKIGPLIFQLWTKIYVHFENRWPKRKFHRKVSIEMSIVPKILCKVRCLLVVVSLLPHAACNGPCGIWRKWPSERRHPLYVYGKISDFTLHL